MENKEFLDAILGLVSIESIARVNVTPEAPYGEGPAKALQYVMALCEKLGGGIEITTCVRGVPKGSGLGTSSILCAAAARALCWSWRASRISAPRPSAPTTASTPSRPPWRASRRSAMPRPWRKCAARPWKTSLVKEEMER